MSQHDLEIANQTFPATRTDLNNALQALGTLQSGATAPSTTYANMLWYDTANDVIKLRNEADDAWVSLLNIDQTSDVAVLISKLTSVDGSASIPSISFSSDTNTGLYRSGTDELSVTTAGSNRMRVKSDGTVQVNGADPVLAIKDTDSTGSSQTGQLAFVDSAGSTKAQLGFLSGSSVDLEMNNTQTSGHIHFKIASTDILDVLPTGIDVTGEVVASGDVTAFSDERLKSDIKTISNALDIVTGMRGCRYTKDGKQSVGVIAQEVMNVLPEVVNSDKEYFSVAYGNIVAVLIEAIKELREEVAALRGS